MIEQAMPEVNPQPAAARSRRTRTSERPLPLPLPLPLPCAHAAPLGHSGSVACRVSVVSGRHVYSSMCVTSIFLQLLKALVQTNVKLLCFELPGKGGTAVYALPMCFYRER